MPSPTKSELLELLPFLNAQERAELDALLGANAHAAAWRAGDLRYKLHSEQLAIYEQIEGMKSSRFVLEIARQFGKTRLLSTMSVETCIKTPRCRVAYGAPTLKHLEEFILPTLEEVCADAPPGLRSKFNAAKSHWEFENGSYIHLFGCDDKHKANRGRGPKAARVVLDECGFVSILAYVIESVVEPQLIHSGGDLLLGSTPAEEPDHDFTHIAEVAEANGTFARRTIYENPLLTPERIEKIIEDRAKDAGLTPEQYVETDHFRREYLAERVVNKLLLVVPEWQAAREKLLVRVPRPEFFDGMSMLDPGGADPHAALFGYWHFPLAKWVIEDELLLRNGENTQLVQAALKAKEAALWGVDKWEGTLRSAANPEIELVERLPDWMKPVLYKEAGQQPYARWTDTQLQLVRDLYELHGMAWYPTRKDDKQLQVNNFRVMVQAGEVLVDPRCEGLDRHLRTTVWKDHKRKTYARRAGEHGDLLDCAVYGARNLSRRNPFPPGWGRATEGVRDRRYSQPNVAQATARVLLGNNPLAAKLLGRR